MLVLLTNTLTTIWQILPIPLSLALLWWMAAWRVQRDHAADLDGTVAGLRAENLKLYQENCQLRATVAAVNQQARQMVAAAEGAREAIRGLEQRLDGRDGSAIGSELNQARQHIATLQQRNLLLTMHALAHSGHFIKRYDN